MKETQDFACHAILRALAIPAHQIAGHFDVQGLMGVWVCARKPFRDTDSAAGFQRAE